MNPGGTGSTEVTVSSLNGYSGTVDPRLAWGEALGIQFSNVVFSPDPVTLTSGGQAKSTLSFDISDSAQPGVYNMKVYGVDSQSQSKNTNLQLIVRGTGTQNPVLESWEITPTSTRVGNDIELNYYIYNPNSEILQVTLGATMRSSNGQLMVDGSNDIDDPVSPGRNWYKRSFRIDPEATPGYYDALLEVHKAHLAEKYSDSGWIDNSFEIKTIDSTLNDLLNAERIVYEKRIKYIDDDTRQMVCSYVYFNQNFDYELLEHTKTNLIKSGIFKLLSFNTIGDLIVGPVIIIKDEWKNRDNHKVYSICMQDDALYSTTLNKLRSSGEYINIINDLEKKEQIKTTHANFVKFINEYSINNTNEVQLEQVLQEQIELFDSTQGDALKYELPLLRYSNALLNIGIGTDNKIQAYKIVTLGLSTGGCLVAIGATGVSLGAAVPLLAVCSFSVSAISSFGEDAIDISVYDQMLMFIYEEFRVYNKLLDEISNDYTYLISSSQSAISNLKLLPNGKLISIEASNMKVGETQSVTLKFSNLGTDSLQAIGYLNIYNNSEYFTTLKTSPLTINGESTEDISVSFTPPFDGDYKINGYVTYTNKKTDSLSKQIVVSPVYGAIVVNTNNENAKFLLWDTYSFLGAGTSWTTSEAPIGTYNIVFESIDSYDTPPPQELELTPDGTITFYGEYIKQIITHSVTLHSNKPDIPLIADGKVILSNQLPKTFTWSENSEHTIYAQSEVYKDASTKYAFIKWGDGNTNSERTIVINSDKTYSAEYKTQYYLTLKTNPENIGTVFGAGWYDENSPVELSAPTITGFDFNGWSMDGSLVNGNPTTITMNAAHNVVANYAVTDSEPPTVIDKTPTGTNVPVNTKITVTFSEVMNEESVKSAFSISSSIEGDYSWSANAFSYTPNYFLFNGIPYTVTVGTGAKDLAGNNLQAPISWQFTTKSELPFLTTIKISPSSASLIVGDTQTFTAEPEDQFGNSITTTVTWTSSDTNIGTIDPNTGVFAAIAEGTTKITATSGSISGSSDVIIKPEPPLLTTITVSPSSVSLIVGDTQTFTASPRDQFGNPITATVTWSCNETNVDSIDQNGLFTAKALGTTTIKATSGSINTTVTVVVRADSSPDYSNKDSISIGSAEASANSVITIPVSIANVSNITGISFNLLYDPTIATVSNVAANNNFVSASVIPNIDNTNGITTIAMTSTSPISVTNETAVIDITYDIVGATGTSTTLQLQNVQFSDTNFNPFTPSIIINGSIEVRTKGDFNNNGRVDIGDVAKVAYMVVDKVAEDIGADFNGNGRVDIGDAAKIAYYLVGKVPEL